MFQTKYSVMLYSDENLLLFLTTDLSSPEPSCDDSLQSVFFRAALNYEVVRTNVSHDSSVLTKPFIFLFMLAHNERFITNLVWFMVQTEQGTFFGVSGTGADPVK